jgi:hypothetical protein
MYTLDTESAKQADTRSNRIEDTGPYVGVIVYAVEIPPNANGTKGVGFKFKTEAGQESYLPLYTHNGKGDALPSFKALNAVMTCAKVRTLTPTPGVIKQWDNDAKAEVDKSVNVFPEIAFKKIGLFIEMETSTYEGKTRRRPVLVGAFEPGTLFTAKEILDKATKAETYAKFAATLRDREQGGKKAAPAASGNGSPRVTDFDDDIPF